MLGETSRRRPILRLKAERYILRSKHVCEKEVCKKRQREGIILQVLGLRSGLFHLAPGWDGRWCVKMKTTGEIEDSVFDLHLVVYLVIETEKKKEGIARKEMDNSE